MKAFWHRGLDHDHQYSCTASTLVIQTTFATYTLGFSMTETKYFSGKKEEMICRGSNPRSSAPNCCICNSYSTGRRRHSCVLLSLHFYSSLPCLGTSPLSWVIKPSLLWCTPYILIYRTCDQQSRTASPLVKQTQSKNILVTHVLALPKTKFRYFEERLRTKR